MLVYLNGRLGEGECRAFRLTRPVVASGLVGAGETVPIDVAITNLDVMQTWDGAAWQPVQAFRAIAGDAYEVVLEYKDVLGNIFRNVYPKGIWTNPTPDVADPATREQMMTRQNRPMPVFLIGRQAVRTQTKAPPLMPTIPPGETHQL